jgi:hypothetical protein
MGRVGILLSVTVVVGWLAVAVAITARRPLYF